MMSSESDSSAKDPVFELRLKGDLSDRLVEELGAVRRRATTTLVVPAIDRAYLHSVIRRIEDLGLELLSVQEVVPDMSADTTRRADARDS